MLSTKHVGDWRPSNCINDIRIASATNMVTDFMVSLIPVPVIWKLNMPTVQCIGIMATFSLGLFITAISVIRIESLLRISFTDPTWNLPMGLFWTVLEPELGILVANFPLMRPYLAGALPSKWSTSSSSWRGKEYHDNFERRAAERAVPLQNFGGGWTDVPPVIRATPLRHDEVPTNVKDDSQTEGGFDSDAEHQSTKQVVSKTAMVH
ncbi:hypothetical protein BX600DRAFT_518237 [Xylariales sp. PMI_506]|nr:hypothetical protein BX600DRAFT_518237 [Xylariales sp. PMI_506]